MDKESRNNGPCKYGLVTRERVDNFIDMFNKFRDNDFKSLVKKVDLIGRRPSWAVSAIIWILSSATVGMIVRAFILGG